MSVGATIDPHGIRLLVVDPQEDRRAALAAQLARAGYDTVTESADATACVRPDQTPSELMLLALDGSNFDAIRLAAIRTALPDPADRPAIIGLSANAGPEARARAAALELDDVAQLPLDDSELAQRVGAVLELRRLRSALTATQADVVAQAAAGAQVLEEAPPTEPAAAAPSEPAPAAPAPAQPSADNDTIRESLSVLAAMADYHDDDTHHHSERVGDVAAAIAEALGFPPAAVELLRAAAPLHDIGKVGISRRILLKPGKLTPSEWLHMQHHVDVGAKILGAATAPVLVLAAEIARTHHERFDGTGYSAGLQGEEIPLAGRIVAVADVWDTLTHDRPYRPAWEPERALAEITSQAGAHFDPRIVQAFASLDLVALHQAGEPAAATV